MFVVVFLVVYMFSNNDKGENENKEYRITLICMIMNDHMKHIRYYNLGWPGNVHNNS